MNTVDLIAKIFYVCIFPLLGALTTYAIAFIKAKSEEIKLGTSNERAKKYMDMITDTITRCVIATNQTYVDSLKQRGEFTIEAQEEAFQRTLNSVLAILSNDAKDYIREVCGDLNVFLTELIEAQVAKEKK